MALLIPSGFAQLTIPHRFPGLAREAVITFGVDAFSYAGAGSLLCDDNLAAYMAELGQELDSEVTVGPVRGSLGVLGGPPLAIVGTQTDTGSRAAGMQPANVALLIQKRSQLGGKRGRGRMYVPWILRDEEVTETGGVDAVALAAFQSHATDWRDDLEEGTTGSFPSPMVLLHDSSGLGPEPPPTPVTQLTVDPRIATQRRRLAR